MSSAVERTGPVAERVEVRSYQGLGFQTLNLISQENTSSGKKLYRFSVDYGNGKKWDFWATGALRKIAYAADTLGRQVKHMTKQQYDEFMANQRTRTITVTTLQDTVNTDNTIFKLWRSTDHTTYLEAVFDGTDSNIKPCVHLTSSQKKNLDKYIDETLIVDPAHEDVDGAPALCAEPNVGGGGGGEGGSRPLSQSEPADGESVASAHQVSEPSVAEMESGAAAGNTETPDPEEDTASATTPKRRPRGGSIELQPIGKSKDQVVLDDEGAEEEDSFVGARSTKRAAVGEPIPQALDDDWVQPGETGMEMGAISRPPVADQS